MADAPESVELEKTATGWKGKLTGQNIFVIAASVCFAVAGVVLVDHRNESRAAMAEMAAKQEKGLAAVAAAIEKSTEAQEASQYIFTLSAEERTRLRLDMPASLRARMR